MRLRNKLSIYQKLIHYNSFLIFGFYPLISMHKINSINKSALQVVNNDFTSNFDECLAKGNHCRIHERNLKSLIIQVYKCLHGESPNLLNNIFIYWYFRSVPNKLSFIHSNIEALMNLKPATYRQYSKTDCRILL